MKKFSMKTSFFVKCFEDRTNIIFDKTDHCHLLICSNEEYASACMCLYGTFIAKTFTKLQ